MSTSNKGSKVKKASPPGKCEDKRDVKGSSSQFNHEDPIDYDSIPTIEFGHEATRDLYLVAGKVRFHVHRAILGCYGGEPIRTMMDLANHGEPMVQHNDDPDAWRILLTSIYNYKRSCIPEEAAKMASVVDKYDFAVLIPVISAALSQLVSRQYRKPPLADLLMRLDTDIVDRWFKDYAWVNSQVVQNFLSECQDERARTIAARRAYEMLSVDCGNSSGFMPLANALVSLYRSGITGNLKEIVCKAFANPGCQAVRTPKLADELARDNKIELVEKWFQDKAWAGLKRLQDFQQKATEISVVKVAGAKAVEVAIHEGEQKVHEQARKRRRMHMKV